MLTTLKIKNYALIRDIEINFSKGLNVLTGETGAGKSIIIGALNIAIGERGYAENIRTGEDKSEIEAIFEIKNDKNLYTILNEIAQPAGINLDENQLIIKREISKSGKGKIYINNTIVGLAVLEKIGNYLVDIHGQHEHQSLLKVEMHIEFLDLYSKTFSIRYEISDLYRELEKLNNELKNIYELEKDKHEKLEIINYKLNELKLAELNDPEEYNNLLMERTKLVNIETIKILVNNIIISLMPSSLDQEGNGAIDLLAKVGKNIEEIEKYENKVAKEYKTLLEETLIKAKDIKDFFLNYLTSIDFDKNYLKKIEDRIELIEDLMKKFKKNNFNELLSYSKELEKEKKQIELNDSLIKQKEKEKQDILRKLSILCVKLSEIRQEKAKELSKKIEDELKQLNIINAIFKIDISYREAENEELFVLYNNKKIKFTEKGIDNVEFLISLNPGEEVKPLAKIASGGEISRIMLAIKNILAETDIIPVMVFDEIDIGVSGKVASDIGAKLYSLSKKKQIICITHLPQIACYSDIHFSVEKFVKDNKTETSIKKLNKNEKIKEIAKLISGDKVTDASIKSAEELVNSAQK